MSDRATSLRPLRPRALKEGDRVHLVSPAGPVLPELLNQGIEVLESWGLEVVVDDQVYGRRRPFDYLAGDDEQRLTALMKAFADPQCRAVICSRGGYGTMRLLPHLDAQLLKENPKLLVGFSDITALHLYFAGVAGLATLHGPVVKSFRLHDHDPFDSLAHLRQALFATSEAPAAWEGLRTVRPGIAEGPVFGGNLSLIIPLLSSPYCPDLSGAILIVEDIEEQDYRLDRLLTALRLSRRANIAGLVLGDFSNCHGVYVDEAEMETFLDQLGAEFDCPVVADAPVGHGSRNICFPVGVAAKLDAHAGTLSFQTHAVL